MSELDNPEADFRARVEIWAARLRVKPRQVRIQRMVRKWASCSTAGRISFDTLLLHESEAFQNYVIVHELLHLKVPNHGRLFKSLMALHLPEQHGRFVLQERGLSRRADDG